MADGGGVGDGVRGDVGGGVVAVNERQRILHLRALALRNVQTAYEPHQELLERLGDLSTRKVGVPCNAADINRMAWRYRRQISPELWPAPMVEYEVIP